MTATDVLRAEDLAVDHELADIAQSFRFLLDLTPVDLVEARRRFREDGRMPAFTYRPLEDDPTVIETRLGSVDVESVQDHTLAHLLLAKHREVALQLQMLRCRGSADFLALSTELYGAVNPGLLAEAERLLADVDPSPPDRDGSVLDAGAFAARAEQELAHYRKAHPDLSAHVELRDDSSGVMVSNGDVLVAPTARVAEARVEALLHHEVGTHVVTYVNGCHQPLHLMAAGLAGYDETQEGLAVFAEHLVGGLTAGRLRQLAARVVAVHRMVEGEGFAEVHQGLVDAGVGRAQSFTITMRVFRAGGLTKDAVYLRGLHDVVSHVAAGKGLDVLWLGKLPLTAAPLVEDLLERGALVPPLLWPRYLDDPACRQRLERIDRTTSLTDLIGGGA